MNTTTADRLIEEYLQALWRAAASLPPDVRDDLVTGIEQHIAEARATGASSEADVRTLLDRLGHPEAIVAEASTGAVPSPPGPSVKRVGMLEFAAVACLILAELTALTFVLIPLGLVFWLAGLVCLLLSGAWTMRQKMRALAVLASGFLVASILLGVGLLATTTSSSGCTGAEVSTVRAVPPTDAGNNGQPRHQAPAKQLTAPTDDCTDSGSGPDPIGLAVLVGLAVLLVVYVVCQVITVRVLLRSPIRAAGDGL
jgi:HAAS